MQNEHRTSARKTVLACAAVVLACCLAVFGMAGCSASNSGGGSGASTSAGSSAQSASSAISVKVLIMAHFESGMMTGDSVGEAQLTYEEYMQGNKTKYTLSNGQDCYVSEDDGIALCVTGEGKTLSASSFSALLCDTRFDFSHACILAIGCAGGNMDYTAMGDVCLVTAAVDYDFGHTVDSSECADAENARTWYPLGETEENAMIRTDAALVDAVYALVKDIELETTPGTVAAAAESFPGREASLRGPKVLKGTAVSSDNYWKGTVGHDNALAKVAYYGCPDPFAVTEMEDIAFLTVARQYGVLDQIVDLRAVVNADEFMNGATPETLWGISEANGENADLSSDTVDIFDTAMENMLKVEMVIIDAALAGKLPL